jgi:hypothetical protein
MGSIYQNAYVTIAAASSHGNHISFLQHEHWPHATERQWGNSKVQITIPYQFPRGKESVLYVRKEYPHHEREYLKSSEPDPSAPLNGRAWAFQERVLANRLIEFGVNELHWKCGKVTRHECGASQSSIDHWLMTGRWRQAISTMEVAKLYAYWRQSVCTYTQRQLTFASDRLPALSGIAATFSDVLEDNYLAGIWEQDIVNGLSWHSVKPSNRPISRPQGPSWSWASIEGPVSYDVGEYSMHEGSSKFQLLSFECKPRGKNKFGEVENAQILVSGLAIELRLASIHRYDPEESYPLLSIFKGRLGQGHSLDSMYVGMIPDTKLIPVKVQDGEGNFQNTIARDLENGAIAEVDGSVLCLLIGDRNRNINALVLGYSSRCNGAFERLGVIQYGYVGSLAQECRRLFEGATLRTLKLV